MGCWARIGLGVALLAAMPAFAAEPGKTYEQWVAMAEAGDPGVDYTALRQAYVRSPAYDGYGSSWRDAKTEFIQAANKHDCSKAIAAADAIRKADYTYPLLHLTLANCYDSQGDAEHAKREEAVFEGLRDSLFKSGDGKSPDTAFVVVTMSEEYFVLIWRKLAPKGQALVHKGEHNYDRMEGVNTETGDTEELYFNVDALFGSLLRKFGGEKQE
jgi:hypothetical protein